MKSTRYLCREMQSRSAVNEPRPLYFALLAASLKNADPYLYTSQYCTFYTVKLSGQKRATTSIQLAGTDSTISNCHSPHNQRLIAPPTRENLQLRSFLVVPQVKRTVYLAGTRNQRTRRIQAKTRQCFARIATQLSSKPGSTPTSKCR